MSTTFLNSQNETAEYLNNMDVRLLQTIKTQEFSDINWGETRQIVIENFDGWIKDMTLKIELPALITDDTLPIHTAGAGNIPTTGYINWVDSIGHAIIEGLEVELTGLTTKIVNMNFPYGHFLDIYNELNDQLLNEWEQIGKNKTNDVLKIFQSNKVVLYVPLHLWFSRSTESAFPSFLFKNKENKLNIKLKIREYKNLIISSSTSNVPTSGIGKPKITLIYDIIKPDPNNRQQINKIEELKKKFIKKPYEIIFDKYNYVAPFVATTNDFNIPLHETNPIKELIFVMPVKKRTESSNNTTGFLINELITDINGNDYFNYENDTTISDLGGSNDAFKNLTLKINKEDFQSGASKNLDAKYLRRHVPYYLYNKTPLKHIYVINFSNLKYNNNNFNSKNIHSFLENDDNDTLINFKFDNLGDSPIEPKLCIILIKEINRLQIYTDKNNPRKIILRYNQWK